MDTFLLTNQSNYYGNLRNTGDPSDAVHNRLGRGPPRHQTDHGEFDRRDSQPDVADLLILLENNMSTVMKKALLSATGGLVRI